MEFAADAIDDQVILANWIADNKLNVNNEADIWLEQVGEKQVANIRTVDYSLQRSFNQLQFSYATIVNIVNEDSLHSQYTGLSSPESWVMGSQPVGITMAGSKTESVFSDIARIPSGTSLK